MKHPVVGIVAFFVILFAYTKLVGPIPFSVNQVTTQKTDTFSVTGQGKATQVPDKATTNVGVLAQGATVTQVQEVMNQKINAVSDGVKKLGIDAKDIKTSSYNISPMYDYAKGRAITGYQANTNLTITIKDIAKANSVIDAATAAGANTVSGISFDISDKSKAENEARTEAVAEARKKAEDAARIAGFKLGRVINYAEGFGGGVRPVPMLAKADSAGTGESTQIEPGSNEVTVTVTLSFEIQ